MSTRIDLKFALAVFATVLVSYHGLGYDLCILALAVLLIVGNLKEDLSQLLVASNHGCRRGGVAVCTPATGSFDAIQPPGISRMGGAALLRGSGERT